MMQLNISVGTADLDRIAQSLGSDMTTAVVYAAGLELQKFLQIPPAKEAGAFSRLATPKQKRAYWAQVRAGQINHGANGYMRRGDLVRKWVVVPIGTGRVKVSNDYSRNGKPVAQFVYGPGALQQPFHAASGWPRVDTVMRDAKVRAKIQATVDKTVKNLLSRL